MKRGLYRVAENRFKKGLETIKSIETLKESDKNLYAEIDTDNVLGKVLQKKEKKSDSHINTFYLSHDVQEELNKLSKKTGKSKSKIVNEILSLVLFKNTK